MTANDLLLDYVFSGQPHVLRATLREWLSDSRRFADFVADNRDKIRKKFRLNVKPDDAADVAWELDVARRLCGDKRLSLAYEATARGQPYGPDFRVSYTTSFDFNLEVTRVRVASPSAEVEARRLADATVGKLRQLAPNLPNVVAVAAPNLTCRETDYAAHMAALRRAAEKREPVAPRGFDSAVEFLRAHERLSAAILLAPSAEDNGPTAAIVWRNSNARKPLPAKAIAALREHFV